MCELYLNFSFPGLRSKTGERKRQKKKKKRSGRVTNRNRHRGEETTARSNEMTRGILENFLTLTMLIFILAACLKLRGREAGLFHA